jgi:hypothetical protein
MKNFDFDAYGVQGMTTQEMQTIDGGNVFSDIWNCIAKVADAAADAIAAFIENYGDEIIALAVFALTGLLIKQ